MSEKDCKQLLHELCNSLTVVSGYLELQKVNQARLQLRHAIQCVRKLQKIFCEGQEARKKK